MANEALVKATEQLNTIRKVIDDNIGAIQEALPHAGLTKERLVRTAITTLRQSPQLLECTPISVAASIIQSAEVGLSLSNSLGHAYLVPFWNNKHKPSRREAKFIIGYKGFIELARRADKRVIAYAAIVYEKEPFKLLGGTNPSIIHTPLSPEDRGEKKIGVYGLFRTPDGVTFRWLWASEVQKHMERSQARDSGPWKTDPEEMWLKTGIRAAAKWSNLSTDMTRAATIDEYTELDIKTGAALLVDPDAGEIEGGGDEPEKLSSTVKPKRGRPPKETVLDTTASNEQAKQEEVRKPERDENLPEWCPGFSEGCTSLVVEGEERTCWGDIDNPVQCKRPERE